MSVEVDDELGRPDLEAVKPLLKRTWLWPRSSTTRLAGRELGIRIGESQHLPVARGGMSSRWRSRNPERPRAWTTSTRSCSRSPRICIGVPTPGRRTIVTSLLRRAAIGAGAGVADRGWGTGWPGVLAAARAAVSRAARSWGTAGLGHERLRRGSVQRKCPKLRRVRRPGGPTAGRKSEREERGPRREAKRRGAKERANHTHLLTRLRGRGGRVGRMNCQCRAGEGYAGIRSAASGKPTERTSAVRRNGVGPEPIEVEPLGRVRADDPLEVRARRGDSMRTASSSGERLGSARSGSPHTLKYEPSRARRKKPGQDVAVAEAREQGGRAQKRRGPSEEGDDDLVLRDTRGRRAARRRGPRSTAARTLNAVAMEEPMSIDSTPRRVRSCEAHRLHVRVELRLADDGGSQAVAAAASRLPSPSCRRGPSRGGNRGRPRRLAARTRASSSNVVIRGTKASLRSLQTSIVCAAVLEEQPPREPRRLRGPTPRARSGSSREFPPASGAGTRWRACCRRG